MPNRALGYAAGHRIAVRGSPNVPLSPWGYHILAESGLYQGISIYMSGSSAFRSTLTISVCRILMEMVDIDPV